MAISIELTRAFIGKNTKEPTPPVAPERPSLALANTVLLASRNLNSMPVSERSVMDPRYHAALEVIDMLPGTPSWKIAVKEFLNTNYPFGTGSQAYIPLSEHLGIDLKRDMTGACSMGGARRHELREFMINVHGSIDGAIMRGEIGQADKAYQSFIRWSREFQNLYSNSPFPTDREPSMSDIRTTLRSDDVIESWMHRHQQYQRFFTRQPNEVDNDHISP